MNIIIYAAIASVNAIQCAISRISYLAIHCAVSPSPSSDRGRAGSARQPKQRWQGGQGYW